jgi:hypothetical protein
VLLLVTDEEDEEHKLTVRDPQEDGVREKHADVDPIKEREGEGEMEGEGVSDAEALADVLALKLEAALPEGVTELERERTLVRDSRALAEETGLFDAEADEQAEEEADSEGLSLEEADEELEPDVLPVARRTEGVMETERIPVRLPLCVVDVLAEVFIVRVPVGRELEDALLHKEMEGDGERDKLRVMEKLSVAVKQGSGELVRDWVASMVAEGVFDWRTDTLPEKERGGEGVKMATVSEGMKEPLGVLEAKKDPVSVVDDDTD